MTKILTILLENLYFKTSVNSYLPGGISFNAFCPVHPPLSLGSLSNVQESKICRMEMASFVEATFKDDKIKGQRI